MRAASFVSWASVVAMASAAAADETEILIESFADPTHAWTTMSDPVMGGLSTSSVAIADGVGRFEGEVAIVPFLHAPGFIQMLTSRGETGTYPDVSSCTSLRMNLMADLAYDGYRVSFGTVHLPEGHHAYGYKADFAAPVGAYADVVIPFTAFSAKWNEGTGDQEVSCAENAAYCPDAATLQNMATFAIWGEGKEGSVRLSVKSISAVGCSGDAPAPASESIEMEEISNSIEMEEVSVSTSEISIESFASPSLTWTSTNDPVMGGQSTGLVSIENGVGVFDGEVKEVSFLHAPGFIKMAGSGTFPDVSACSSLQLNLMAEEAYTGYRLGFGNIQLPGSRFSRGYHADFQAPVGEYGLVTVPFNAFSAKWDPGTGDVEVRCEDDAQYCPDMSALRNMETLSIYGEGVEGSVHLKVKSIAAVGCSGEASSLATPTSMQATLASVEKANQVDVLKATHASVEKANQDEVQSIANQTGAGTSNSGTSLWAIGALVGTVAFVGSVVSNLARSKRESYVVVQEASSANEIV